LTETETKTALEME